MVHFSKILIKADSNIFHCFNGTQAYFLALERGLRIKEKRVLRCMNNTVHFAELVCGRKSGIPEYQCPDLSLLARDFETLQEYLDIWDLKQHLLVPYSHVIFVVDHSQRHNQATLVSTQGTFVIQASTSPNSYYGRQG